jgi:hypothetical protein
MSTKKPQGGKQGGQKQGNAPKKQFEGKEENFKKETVKSQGSSRDSKHKFSPPQTPIGVEKSTITKIKVQSVDISKLKKIENVAKNEFLSESKAPGKTGKPVTLVSNYFPLSLPKGPFFQYVVHFQPKV